MEMKRWVLFLMMILILGSFVLAEKPYEETAKATFNALKTGDYSILEPYLDDAMKKAFDEKGFKGFRENLVSKYGPLQSYEFVKEGKAGEFILGYYDFKFEKADVTLRMVFKEVNGKYKLSGLWIDKVSWKEEGGLPLALTVIFPILGGILALITFYALGFKLRGAELILGFFLVVITLFVQNPIQQAPFLALGVKSNSDVLARGASFVVLASIWLGFVAGFFQEGLKYIFVRNKTLRAALFIGVGFGLGEAILIPFIQLVQSMALGSAPSSTLMVSLLSMGERYLAALFHAGTTIVLAYAYKNGFGRKALLSLSIAHGVVDSFAAHYQLTQSQVSLLLTYISLIAISFMLLRYGIPEVKGEEEEKIVW
ncbi:DUF3887 domain-containing protein [Palaeococcus sp. (in: euryarchaeotes)]